MRAAANNVFLCSANIDYFPRMCYTVSESYSKGAHNNEKRLSLFGNRRYKA